MDIRMRILSFICAILLLLAIANLPVGYYTVLRLTVTLYSVVIIITKINKLSAVWIILFVCIALLFNPVIPVYFYRKSLWLPIDIITAGIFILYGFMHNNKQAKKLKSPVK